MQHERDSEAIARMVPDLTAIRRDLHRHPELAYEEHRTAQIVAEQLRAAGLSITEGIGGTGVVGTLKRGTSRRAIGLRADMDALGFDEETGLDHASIHPGKFHGCGHDGHTAMLVGAARHIAQSVEFDGTIHFIFQPAEEGKAGARAMIAEGLFDRFDCDEVYALHNWPDLPAGQFQTKAGPIMAAADRFEISIRGKGGHAALPHQTPDTIIAAADLVLQLNTIVSRRVRAFDAAVLSVTMIAGGKSHNVLPAETRLMGTARTFAPEIRDLVERSVREMAAGVAGSHGVAVDVEYDRYYPATVNDATCAGKALAAARAVAGLEAASAPEAAFTSEDFSFMLQARPGAYCWLGQGKGDAAPALHNPQYDFNDEVLAAGVAWFVSLVRQELPTSA